MSQVSVDRSAGELLHAAGMRATLPRRAVLEVLAGTAGHLTAENVRDALAQRGVDLPRSSVNNVLAKLAGAGLIGRVDSLPGATRFERETEEHDHFWCTGCRAVADVPARRGPLPPLPGAVGRVAVTYLGNCNRCSPAEP